MWWRLCNFYGKYLGPIELIGIRAWLSLIQTRTERHSLIPHTTDTNTANSKVREIVIKESRVISVIRHPCPWCARTNYFVISLSTRPTDISGTATALLADRDDCMPEAAAALVGLVRAVCPSITHSLRAENYTPARHRRCSHPPFSCRWLVIDAIITSTRSSHCSSPARRHLTSCDAKRLSVCADYTSRLQAECFTFLWLTAFRLKSINRDWRGNCGPETRADGKLLLNNLFELNQ